MENIANIEVLRHHAITTHGIRYALRWLSVIPFGLLAAVGIAFPIHWLVMMNLGGWSREPLIVIEDMGTLASIERFLQSMSGPFAFVYVGAHVAPSYKTITSTILSCSILIGAPASAYWMNNTQDHYYVECGIAQILAHAIGVASAVYLTFSHNRKLKDRV